MNQNLTPKLKGRKWIEYPNIFLDSDLVQISGICIFCFDDVKSDDFFSKTLEEWETKDNFINHHKTKLCMKCLNRVYDNMDSHEIWHEYEDDEDNKLMRLYYRAKECFCETCGEEPEHWRGLDD